MRVKSYCGHQICVDIGEKPIKRVIDHFNIKLEMGKFTVLFGVNGAGKSTLLSAMAKVTSLSDGSIRHVLDSDDNINSNINIAFLHQDYRKTNHPWRNVYQNVTFPLEFSGKIIDTIKIKRIIKCFLPELKGNEYPYLLSGGQQQLLALSRAFASEADLILSDEAMGAVDVARGYQTIQKIDRLWRSNPVPILWVSHNVDEGVLLADEILLMTKRGQMSKILKNEMERPRSIDMLDSTEHRSLRRQIIDFLMSEST